MDKINLGANVFVYPMPVTLVGALVGGRVNFMTVAWLTRVNFNPPYLGVALNKAAYTPLGIRENRTFSVNFPSAEMVEKTDYCGLVSGRKTDKSGLFEVFFGELKTAPLIKDCPLSMECRLLEIIDFPTNQLFVGEIVAGYSEEDFLTDRQPDLFKMNPLLLTMPDSNYWTVLGEHAGRAWSAGKKLRQKEK